MNDFNVLILLLYLLIGIYFCVNDIMNIIFDFKNFIKNDVKIYKILKLILFTPSIILILIFIIFLNILWNILLLIFKLIKFVKEL